MICFASVTENVRITRWRIGGLFATNTRQSRGRIAQGKAH